MERLKRIGKLAVVGGAVMALWTLLAVPAGAVFFSSGVSNTSVQDEFAPLSQPTVIYSADGEVMGRIGLEDRTPVDLEDVSQVAQDAVIAAEDQTFYENRGVDLRANVRALTANVDEGDITQGGSTITQQLVKNRLLTPRQDITRKVREAIAAMRLTAETSKDDILEQYLNTVYFGQGSYGINSAASRFFKKDPKDLDLAEGALLAAVISSPESNNPFEYPDRARARRSQVLDQMLKLGYISKDEADEARAAPLPEDRPSVQLEPEDYFVEKVQRDLLNDERLGSTQQERFNAVLKGGLKVYTTLDSKAQARALEAVRSTIPDQPPFTAALVAMRPNNGQVIAMVAGPSFQELQYNLVTQGERQPGSTYKIITLAAALEAGYSPKDSLSGSSPCTISVAGHAPWKTTNAEGGSGGTMTLRSATTGSVNCAYARLIAALGVDRVVDMAHRMGIKGDIPRVLSITLGTAEASPLEMATAMATLANDGLRPEPMFVTRVEGSDGRTLLENKPKNERVIDKEVARTANDILQGVVTGGTGRSARIRDREIIGKTGTTEEYSDAWFLGSVPQLTTAVWMGSPRGLESMRNVGGIAVFGGTYPARIWNKFMTAQLDRVPVRKFPDPDTSLWSKGRYISEKGRGKGSPPASTTAPSSGDAPTTTAPTSTTEPLVTVPSTAPVTVPTTSPATTGP